MRRYRFKGKTDDGIDVFGHLTVVRGGRAMIVTDDEKPYIVDADTVKEWTGFVDKGGQEIYEDAAVKYMGNPCDICYNAFAGKCYIYANGEVVQPLNAKTAQDCEAINFF